MSDIQIKKGQTWVMKFPKHGEKSITYVCEGYKTSGAGFLSGSGWQFTEFKDSIPCSSVIFDYNYLIKNYEIK